MVDIFFVYFPTATALDRANAEGALLPVPKVFDHDRTKQAQIFIPDYNEAVATDMRGRIFLFWLTDF